MPKEGGGRANSKSSATDDCGKRTATIVSVLCFSNTKSRSLTGVANPQFTSDGRSGRRRRHLRSDDVAGAGHRQGNRETKESS